jgi:hypothetical protein
LGITLQKVGVAHRAESWEHSSGELHNEDRVQGGVVNLRLRQVI